MKRKPSGHRTRASPRGQALLETALILPLLLLFLLGILQLTSLQQARLMTEYAAFAAARTGIVRGGNPERMVDAARVSLLPTHARTDDWVTLGAAHARLIASKNESDRVQVTVVPWEASSGPGVLTHGHELDFDDVTSFTEESRSAEDDAANVARANTLRRSTLLTVRVRYLYELKVPLANAVMFLAWYALQQGTLTEAEQSELWRAAREDRTFLLPLSATHRMRMQSALGQRWFEGTEQQQGP